MAKVNPDINPTKDPSYLNYSRPISQPDSNKSAVYEGQVMEHQGQIAAYTGKAAEYTGKAAQFEGQGIEFLLKGIGDVFTGSVKTADNLLRESIKNEAYNNASSIKDEYIKQLESLGAPQQVVPAPVSTQTGTGPEITSGELTTKNASMTDVTDAPMSIIPDEISSQNKPPAEVANLRERLDTMAASRANNKMSYTEYAGRLDTLAKDLRSRHPGYIDLIDQTFSRATGENIANFKLRSVVADLNAASAKTTTERDRILSYIRSHNQLKDAPQVYSQYESGQINANQVLIWANKQLSIKHNLDMRRAMRDEAKGAHDFTKLEDSQALTTRVTEMAGDFFERSLFSNPQLGSGANVAETLFSAAKGGSIDPVVARQLGEGILAGGAQAKLAMMAEARRNGWVKTIGAKAVEEEVDAQVAATFGTVAGFITNKELGPAYAAANAVKVLSETNLQRLFNDKNIGKYVRDMKSLTDAGGPEFATAYFKAHIENGLSGPMKEYVNSLNQKLILQPDIRKSGKPFTVTDALDAASGAGANPQEAGPKAAAMTNEQIIKNIELVTNPTLKNDELKSNLIKSLGTSFISRFEEDYFDENTGRQVPGQRSIFARLTTKEFVSEVKRLGEKDRSVVTGYANWAQTEHKRLFGQDARDLREIKDTTGLVVGWDTDTKSFNVKMVVPKFDRNNIASRPDIVAVKYERAKDVIGRLNESLIPMKNIAESFQKPIEPYILGTLTQSGANLQGSDIPSMLLQQLKRAGTPEPKTGDKKSNFAAEDLPSSGNVAPNAQRGSLESFLSDPAGVVARKRQNAPAGSPARIRGNLTDSPQMGMEVIDVGPNQDINELLRRR